MPLDICATYVLDGEEVDPADVVGESGELTVTYTVKNVTQRDADRSPSPTARAAP